jgi:hypothetical protein
MWFKKKIVNVDIDNELVKLRAKLARIEQLPESDFTMYPSKFGQQIKHGVDEKPEAIARVKADIAYYESLKSNAFSPANNEVRE